MPEQLWEPKEGGQVSLVAKKISPDTGIVCLTKPRVVLAGLDIAASEIKSGDLTTTWSSGSVSPSELRKALSSLNKTAVQFNESEMHDASEVNTYF